MKKFIAYISLFLLFLVVPCWAADHSITVTWDYPNPPSDLAGFELRINGDDSNLIGLSGNVREWTGYVPGEDGQNVVDMRAKDTSDLVSIWSEPAYFNPTPDVPTSVKVIVEVIVTIK